MALTKRNAEGIQNSTCEGRYCNKCKQFKSWDDFEKTPPSDRCYMDRRATCRACRLEQVVASRFATPEKTAKYFQNRKEWLKREKYYARYNHGMTKAQYEAFHAYHENQCVMCGKTTKLCIDHNHHTGHFRGLLCHHCNTDLGTFYDSCEVALSIMKNIELEALTARQRGAITRWGGIDKAIEKVEKYFKHIQQVQEDGFHVAPTMTADRLLKIRRQQVRDILGV